MSQSLRERIEGLQLVVSWGPAEEEHDLIDKADVLRIIAEHEREQAAVAIGVRPVAQLSEKIGELPDAVPPRDDIEAAKIRIAELEEQMRALGDDRGWRWDSLDGNREDAQADLDHLIAERALSGSDCHAGTDVDCYWSECPQIKDGEPRKSGRSCPRWIPRDDS